MKIALSLFIVAFVRIASASEIRCWLTSFQQAQVPFMVAQSPGPGRLNDIKFLYKKQVQYILSDFPALVSAELITSNHSPYRGLVRYLLPGDTNIVFPTDLSDAHLVDMSKKNSAAAGENGVVISTDKNPNLPNVGSGRHVSYRLICRSNI